MKINQPHGIVKGLVQDRSIDRETLLRSVWERTLTLSEDPLIDRETNPFYLTSLLISIGPGAMPAACTSRQAMFLMGIWY